MPSEMSPVANDAVSVEDYHFRQTDDLFLDANIWLFIVGPRQNRYKTSVYSSAFRRLLEAGMQEQGVEVDYG